MNLQKFSKYLAVFFISLFVLSGCGGNSGGEFKGGNQPAGGNNTKTANLTYKKNFSYDSTNRVVKEDFGNGKYIEYVYDKSGNLISQTVAK